MESVPAEASLDELPDSTSNTSLLRCEETFHVASN